jgi:leader peptidase (prepilin peptidase)/N-methyltransferase
MQGMELVFIGVLGLLLTQVAMVDIRTRRIPNTLNLAIAALGLAHALVHSPGWHGALSALGTGLASSLLLLATMWLAQRISPGARVGAGDLKFLVAASLWVGWGGTMAVLLIACLAATLEAVAVAPWQGFSVRRMRPFGPMLAVGMLAVVILNAHFAGR